MQVAVDISKCAVWDMDVNIRRWVGIHHNRTSDRVLAMRPDTDDVVAHTTIHSGSPVFIHQIPPRPEQPQQNLRPAPPHLLLSVVRRCKCHERNMTLFYLQYCPTAFELGGEKIATSGACLLWQMQWAVLLCMNEHRDGTCLEPLLQRKMSMMVTKEHWKTDPWMGQRPHCHRDGLELGGKLCKTNVGPVYWHSCAPRVSSETSLGTQCKDTCRLA